MYGIIKAIAGSILQVFTLTKGNVNLPASATPYSIAGDCVVKAAADATFEITWNAGGVDTVSILNGDTVGISDADSVKVTVGSIHLMK